MEHGDIPKCLSIFNRIYILLLLFIIVIFIVIIIIILYNVLNSDVACCIVRLQCCIVKLTMQKPEANLK